MQICEKHWAALRKAIDDRGLSHLVSVGGKEAIERIVAEVKGEETPFTYDPLLDCNNMITCQALECGGLAMLADDVCPVCTAMVESAKQNPDVTEEDVEKHWIDGPADAALMQCKQDGLIPTPGVPEVKENNDDG